MKIKEIKVEGLFGLFDHTIPMHEDGLTMIYGINGIGKTMIMRLVNSVLDIYDRPRVRYKRCMVYYQNKILIEFNNTEYPEGLIYEDFDLEKDLTLMQLFQKDPFVRYNRGKLKNSSGKDIDIEDLNLDKDLKIPTGRSLTQALTGLLNFPIAISSIIPSQRLFLSNENSVIKYSQDFSELLIRKEQAYNRLSEQLELSLGKRLKDKTVRTDFSFKELKEAKGQVEQRLKELKAVGLLTNQPEPELDISEEMDEVTKAIMAVNFQDFTIKLVVFDDLYERAKLFLDILNNRRLSYKTISISKEKGFTFQDIKGNPIPLEGLSTGEQNELVILYKLLFEIPKGSFVMIDEPEISFHVIWQKSFVTDMQEIIKLRDLQILVATHSPSIINGNWDLTVSLEGLEEEVYAK